MTSRTVTCGKCKSLVTVHLPDDAFEVECKACGYREATAIAIRRANSE